MVRHYIIIAVVAYLCGSIPFGYILVRLFRGQDIRASGSGNIGATNVARSGATGLALVTLLLDGLKGYAAVGFSSFLVAVQVKDFVFCSAWSDFSCTLNPQLAGAYYVPLAMAAVFAVAGHMFPVWLKFRGGKGVATAVGAFLAIAPHALLASLLLFAPIVAFTRYVSLGSIVATAAFPLFVWLLNREAVPNLVILMISAASLLIIAKHHGNIHRLISGTENRFTLKRKAATVQLTNED